MSINKLPPNVRQEIRDKIFELADEHQYLHKGKPENNVWLGMLVKHSDVGQRLEDYIDSANLHKYIKEIVNAYSKDRRELPQNIDDRLNSHYSVPVHEIEYVKRCSVSLHKLEGSEKYLAVSRRGFTKWETGMRHLINYVAAKDKLQQLHQNGQLDLILIVFRHGRPMDSSDMRMLEMSLGLVGIKCYWGD